MEGGAVKLPGPLSDVSEPIQSGLAESAANSVAGRQEGEARNKPVSCPRKLQPEPLRNKVLGFSGKYPS